MEALRRLWQHEKRMRQNGDFPCKYGHFGCSDREGGECDNELFAQLSDEERERYENEPAP